MHADGSNSVKARVGRSFRCWLPASWEDTGSNLAAMFQILKITKYAIDKNIVRAFLYSLKGPVNPVPAVLHFGSTAVFLEMIGINLQKRKIMMCWNESDFF